jgi:hypothetical protein
VAGHAHIDSEGSLWSRRIRDDASTRVAVFNDEQQSVVIDIRPSSLPAQVTRWRPESGLVEEPFELAGALRLTLSPGELACFSLADGVTAVPPAVTLDSGWTLRTGDVERLIDVGMGWERQGLPEFSGIGTYRVAFDLTEADLAWPSWELVLPAAHTSAEAEINGRLVGVWGWGPFRCEVDVAVLRAAGNELRVKVASTAANQYYAGTRHQDGGPEPSGLTAAPMLQPAL